MHPVASIFERLGGPARVGGIIGKTTEHAALMRRRASIPVRYWPALVAAEPVEGHQPVSHADLVAAHVGPLSPASPDRPRAGQAPAEASA